MKTKLDIINEIINEGQYKKISFLVNGKRKTTILDGTTAHMLKAVFNAVPPEKQAILNKAHWLKLVDFGWKVTRGAK